ASAYPEIDIPKSLPQDQNAQKKPTALYNAMIHPFQEFGIRGILWYQGESNRNNPKPYKNYMHNLVEAWRKQWKRPELPFYFVQIAPYGYAEYRDGDVLDANLIREAQAHAAQEIPNTGIAITTDVGKCDDIHPPEKQTIADRLANLALAEQYGVEDLAHQGPEYKGMQIKGNKIELSFEFGGETAENQKFDQEKRIRDFEIAGADHKFYPAQVTVNDNQTLTVQSEEVEAPVAVRYGFVDCLEGSLFSEAGLPVSPFRTDSWEK
ncbi:MAG: sialate O-acetylesterase, partial [Pricia sp.]